MSDIRVVIVAQDPLVRAGLAALLAGQHGCLVAGQLAGDGDLLAELDVYRPDVVIWDMGWESGLAPERLADLSEEGLPVVALLADDDQAADLWTAGARGVLRRDANTERLLAAITAAARGLAVVDPALASALPFARPTLPVEDLTAREIDVLRLMVEGLPNKTIAQRLDISEHTVKFHINAILGKLHAQSRTEAVVHAIRRGLIAL